jgi:hypothetical protein
MAFINRVIQMFLINFNCVKIFIQSICTFHSDFFLFHSVLKPNANRTLRKPMALGLSVSKYSNSNSKGREGGSFHFDTPQPVCWNQALCWTDKTWTLLLEEDRRKTYILIIINFKRPSLQKHCSPFAVLRYNPSP